MNYFIINGQPVNDATLAGITAAFAGTIIAFTIAFYVLLIIAFWKMFTKAGEAGWKSIIPIYNEFIAFRIAWKDGVKNFWIFLIASIVMYIPASTVTVNGATSSTGNNPILLLVASVAAIVALVWYIRFLVKQAQSYNKGTGCAILALLFPSIMTLYYGFASTATYQGPQD